MLNISVQFPTGLAKIRVLLKKNLPTCFFFLGGGGLWVLLGFFGFYWAFLGFITFVTYCVMFHNIA